MRPDQYGDDAGNNKQHRRTHEYVGGSEGDRHAADHTACRLSHQHADRMPTFDVHTEFIGYAFGDGSG